MDPITTAILAALPALAADMVSSAVKGRLFRLGVAYRQEIRSNERGRKVRRRPGGQPEIERSGDGAFGARQGGKSCF